MSDRLRDRREVDDVLVAWLDAVAPDREPPDLLERVLARTAGTRRRPAWWGPSGPFPALRPAPAVTRTLAFAAVFVLVLLAAIAIIGVATQPRRAPMLGPLLAARAGEILIANVDGTVQRRLPTGPVVGAAAWSPDGRRLAYLDGSGGGHVLVVTTSSLEELDRIVLPSGAAAPFAWDPGGTRVAFGVQSDGIATIDVASVASGRPPVPITAAALDATSPSWSPDGSLIAFRGGRGTGSQEVYVVAPDGSSPRQISQLGLGVVTLCGLAWTPDSQTVLFDSSAGGVWAADRDGADPVQISQPGDFGVSCPRSSPDGRLVSANNRLMPSGPLGVWLYDRSRTILGDTTVVHPFVVVPNVDADVWPAVWSPDGRSMAVNGRGQDPRLPPRFIVDPAGVAPARRFFLDDAIVVGWRSGSPPAQAAP